MSTRPQRRSDIAPYRLACASRVDLPSWEVDDLPFHQALTARGVVVEQPAWSDPGVDWASFDAVLLRTPWDYHQHLDAFLAWCDRVAAVRPLWHPPEVVAWNARKTYLLELAARGVPVAPTVLVPRGDVAALIAGLGTLGAERAFLKPVVGATAWQTLRFDALDLAAAASHVDRVQAPLLLQPYLGSVETTGEWSVVLIDGAATHAVAKHPRAGDYRVQDDFGATDRPLPLSPELVGFAEHTLRIAAEVLGRTEPLLYARVDLLHHDGRLVLNELEAIEPSLFFRHGPLAATALADAVVGRLGKLPTCSRVSAGAPPPPLQTLEA